MTENAEEEGVQIEVTESAVPEEQAHEGGRKAGESLGKALNSFMDTLEAALVGRGNTVMVRVNDKALKKLDMLVAAGICKSRSESAAFLLQRGIEASATVFDHIEETTSRISEMRRELLEWVQASDR